MSRRKQIQVLQRYYKLPANVEERLYELADEGHKLTLNEQYMDAIHIWKRAIEMIPEPKQHYSETANFYEGIAYNYQIMCMYPQSLNFMERVFSVLGENANQNPFTMLNMGEIYYELGKIELSVKYLNRAYILEGDEIFDFDVYGKINHGKYLDFLKTKINLKDRV